MAIDRTDWLSIEQNSYRCNKMAIDRSDCHTHHDISWQIMTFEDLLASSIDPQVMPPCLKYQIIIGPGLPCRSNDLVWNIVLFTENFVARKNVWTYINSNRSLLLPNISGSLSLVSTAGALVVITVSGTDEFSENFQGGGHSASELGSRRTFSFFVKIRHFANIKIFS